MVRFRCWLPWGRNLTRRNTIRAARCALNVLRDVYAWDARSTVAELDPAELELEFARRLNSGQNAPGTLKGYRTVFEAFGAHCGVTDFASTLQTGKTTGGNKGKKGRAWSAREIEQLRAAADRIDVQSSITYPFYRMTFELGCGDSPLRPRSASQRRHGLP